MLEPWEKRVDAMRMLLGDNKRNILRADGLRHAIETMGEDLYLELSYYERWMAAIMNVVDQRGVVTRDELFERMAEIEAGSTFKTSTPTFPGETDGSFWNW